MLSMGGAKVVFFTSPYYDEGEQLDGSPWPADDPARVSRLNKLLREVAATHPGTARVIECDQSRRLSVTGWALRVGRTRRYRPYLVGSYPRHTGRSRNAGADRLPSDRPPRAALAIGLMSATWRTSRRLSALATHPTASRAGEKRTRLSVLYLGTAGDHSTGPPQESSASPGTTEGLSWPFTAGGSVHGDR